MLAHNEASLALAGPEFRHAGAEAGFWNYVDVT